MTSRRRIKQNPGSLHVFVSRNTGKEYLVFLPRNYGESDSLVRWIKDPECINGGYWQSKEQEREEATTRNIGEGPKGLLSRMKRLLNYARADSKKRGFKPPSISPEKLVLKWEKQKGLCAACGLPLELLKAHHDHNHETGMSRGFLHASCNFMEGFLISLPIKNRKLYFSWLRKIGVLE